MDDVRLGETDAIGEGEVLLDMTAARSTPHGIEPLWERAAGDKSRNLDSRPTRWSVWTPPLIIVRGRHLISAAVERCRGPRSTEKPDTSVRVLFWPVWWRGRGACAV